MKRLILFIMIFAFACIISSCSDDESEMNEFDLAEVIQYSEDGKLENKDEGNTTSKTDDSYDEEIPGFEESVTASVMIEDITEEIEVENSLPDGNYYRTPTGKRYHIDPDCGGKNSFQTNDISDLTPCKKCAAQSF